VEFTFFSGMPILENVLPALHLAKVGATGVGIPGVEGALNGVLELATMVSVRDSASVNNIPDPVKQTMHSNKDDLAKLEKCLAKLSAIDTSGCGDDLKRRLTTLSSCVDLKKSRLICSIYPQTS
jgi:hypothetical protein